jgi:hypothetical protein
VNYDSQLLASDASDMQDVSPATIAAPPSVD